MIWTGWMEDAACTGADTELFFPSKGQKTAAAMEYCESCPVRIECLEYALGIEVGHGYHHYGIYGGIVAAQRKTLAVEWRSRGGTLRVR